MSNAKNVVSIAGVQINDAEGCETSSDATIGELFAAWFELRSQIGFEASTEGSHLADYIRQQNKLITCAIKNTSAGYDDVLFKLALWRWSKLAPQVTTETLSPSDALAYSAFADLAKILGKQGLLTDRPE